MSRNGVTPPIQSLDRGLVLMELIGRARRPVSLAELTRAVGIDRSSVYRLLNTLRRRGFIAWAPGGKEYVLGTAIWRLANSFDRRHLLRQAAREQVLCLAKETGETVHLVIQDGSQAVSIDCELTTQPVGVPACSGECVPLHCTSVGKALIADYDQEQLAELFGNGPLPRFTRRTIRSLAALAEECERTRQRGFAVDDEEFNAGVRCVAAPIREPGSAVTAAIGISAPSDRLPKGRIKQFGRLLQNAAEIISGKLGSSEPVKESFG